jgi:hypothetical protein
MTDATVRLYFYYILMRSIGTQGHAKYRAEKLLKISTGLQLPRSRYC